MYSTAWKWLIFYGFGLVFFVLTLVVVHWAIEFVTWSSLDSGWAQVLGSVAALGVAIFVMSRQNRHAANLVVESDKKALRLRAASVEQLLIRCQFQIKTGADSIEKANIEGLGKLEGTGNLVQQVLVETRFVLTQIPAHELGSADLVNGLLHLMGSMAVLEMVAQQTADGKKCETGQDSIFHTIRKRADNALAQFRQGQVELAK